MHCQQCIADLPPVLSFHDDDGNDCKWCRFDAPILTLFLRCDIQGAAAALNRDRYGGFHDRHTHGGHVPNPPRLSGSATYRPQLLSGSTLGQSLKRNESDSR